MSTNTNFESERASFTLTNECPGLKFNDFVKNELHNKNSAGALINSANNDTLFDDIPGGGFDVEVKVDVFDVEVKVDVHDVDIIDSVSDLIGFSSSAFPTTKCLICIKNIIIGPDPKSTSLPNTTELTENILLGFSKVFKISPTIYQGIDLTSVKHPLFCSSCNEEVVASLNILREIEKLEKNLNGLKSKIRDVLVESYHCYSSNSRQRGLARDGKESELFSEGHEYSSSSQKNKSLIRRAFAQCWTKPTILISPIVPREANDQKKSRAKPQNFCTGINTRLRERAVKRDSSSKFSETENGTVNPIAGLFGMEADDIVPFPYTLEMETVDAAEQSDAGSLYNPVDDDDDVVVIADESSKSTDNRNGKSRASKRKLQRSNSRKKKPRSQSPMTEEDEDEASKSFQCEFCARIFDKESYKIEVEDGTLEYVYHCDLPRCKWTKPFKTFSFFKDHHTSTCKSRPTFPCEYCDRQCYSAKSLSEHVRARHWNATANAPMQSTDDSSITNIHLKQSFACEFCKRSFHRDDFKTERGEYIFVCDLPNCKTTKPFLSLPKLKHHHRNNCLSRPTLPCEYCSKACYDERNLKHHIISCHTKEFEFICDSCGLGLPTKGSLKEHLLIHQEKQFKCPVCSKFFRRKSNLRLHMQRHGEKILCELCGKGFRCQQDLNNHRFTHSSEKNFPCPICNKFFKSRAYVDSHIWSTHKKARKPKQRSDGQANVNVGTGSSQNSSP